VVSLAQFVAIFHDACGFTIENDAAFSDGDLVDAGGFSECHDAFLCVCVQPDQSSQANELCD